MACDIELEIGAGASPGEFTTRVVDAPSGGEPSVTTLLDVDGLLRDRNALEAAVLASGVSGRGLSAAEQQLRQVGTQLFDALFSGPVMGIYRASLGVALQQGQPLRVVLRLRTPQLAALPWEALFDAESGAYICRTESLIRHVPAPYTPEPLDVVPPLRVLGLVSSPRGMPALDVTAEQERLTQALAGPIADGLIELEWLVQASWEAVQEKLLSDQWHVLHFIGHGDYDVATDQGLIALVGADGRANLVEAGRLADLLNEAHPTPRLVVLNSCSSGEQGTTDLFSGTAAALVRSGISAVAAMQFTVSDPAAIAFSAGFYTAIAHGHSVDDAVRSGRISILGRPHTLEWVTPVLYVRGDSSRLFALAPVAQKKRQAHTPPIHAVVQPPEGEPSEKPQTSVAEQDDGALSRPEVRPQGRRWHPKTVVIASVVILATVAAIAGGAYAIWGRDGGDEQLFRGYILPPIENVTGVDVRAEPRLSSPLVGSIPVTTPVYIVCVAIGDWVEGPGPKGQPRLSTPVWDKVRTEPSGRDLGFVPDVWVNTGGTQARGPYC